MGAHRKSIVKETIDRLEEKMAIGESRYAAKQEIRKDQGKAWSVSDGKIHSFKTRSTYQEHSIRFVKWARDTHHVTNFEQLDPRANELVSEYLQLHMGERKSPYTLQAERSALRMLFNDRSLAKDVRLPVRARSSITRSRGAAAHDRHFQPANWQPLMKFLRATGLRRQELRDLHVRDIYQGHDGQVYVHVENGKGGRPREVQALPGHNEDVWTMREGRPDDAKVFERIPRHLDVHSVRREFAQALYQHYAGGRDLPPPSGRLKRQDYDRAAAERVTWALGHNRIDVVLRHYIR
jgi:integrase